MSLESLEFVLSEPLCGDGFPPQLRRQQPASTGSGVDPEQVTNGLMYLFVFIYFSDLPSFIIQDCLRIVNSEVFCYYDDMTSLSPVLSCKHISYSFGENEVLCDISFSLSIGEVVALVGPNGVGKSTLLKIISGKLSPDRGSITVGQGLRIVYVPQEMSAEDNSKRVCEYIGNVQGFELAVLRLPSDILNRTISELSGGEKSKINLLKLVQMDSDIYVLDEPTNNLDAHALEFLEKTISKHKKRAAFIIVSHDRQLLENTADNIIEIDSHSHESVIYPGPFSEYILLRKKKIENAWKLYNDYIAQKKRLEHSLREKKQWSIVGEKGPKRTDNEKMARGDLKDRSGKVLGRSVNSAQLKLDALEKVEKPNELPVISYSIDIRDRSGDMVFDLIGVKKIFGKKAIGPLDLHIQFGETLAILGDNGAGKTTLLKMLVGKITPDLGSIRKGSGLDIGYLPQETELDDRIILDRVKEICGKDESDFRKLLNNLGITKDEINKNINKLSPGERSRFVLALLIAKKPNCLILDEPTNHLDIYALDFLEEAIRTYEGTTIIVTHDRYFLSRIGKFSRYDM